MRVMFCAATNTFALPLAIRYEFDEGPDPFFPEPEMNGSSLVVYILCAMILIEW